MGIDEIGVDEVGVDEMGSRRSGTTPIKCVGGPSSNCIKHILM